MKLITRDTDYAVRALYFLAERSSEIISVSKLVRNLKIPKPFLRKILQTLNKEGLLKSYKGQGGGFILAIPPEKILLIDLIRIFQGPISLNECIFKKQICPEIKVCNLKKRIDNIEKYVIFQLKSITLECLLEK